MSSYEATIKARMATKYDPALLGGAFRGKGSYAHIFKRLEDNFIDGKYPIVKCVKGDPQTGPIQYNCANHLNSSQAMCIGYFKKFFEKKEYEPLLAAILQSHGVDIGNNSFKAAAFEYEPNTDEGTNFDFYLELDNGTHISWEVKFTEAEFGGTTQKRGDNRRYITKWEDIYIRMLPDCAYYRFTGTTCDDYKCLTTGRLTDDCPVCDKCSIHQFYKYYQISRNIAYAKRDGDYVLFLTPQENRGLDDGRDYIKRYAEKWDTNHILNIYWEDLLATTLCVVDSVPELLDYYQQFKAKYFD